MQTFSVLEVKLVKIKLISISANSTFMIFISLISLKASSIESNIRNNLLNCFKLSKENSDLYK